MVSLDLDVSEPDLSAIDALLEPVMLRALADALTVAEAPEPAASHVRHALEHLAVGDVRAAWPPLVIGVEGLFWGPRLSRRAT